MRAALRDKRRATAIEREVEITLLRAAAMDVWNAVPLGVVLPPEYVQAINRLGCAIRGEWHLLAPVAPSAPEPLEGDSQVAPPPALIDPGATSSEIPRCCENECEDRAEHDEYPGA